MSVTAAHKDFFRGKKVLIADNSTAIKEMIKNSLNAFDVNPGDVQVARSFQDAVVYMKKEKPMLVFSEMDLEGHSGLDLLQIMKTYAQTNDRLFMIATANSQESLVAEAAEEDVDNYILKPFSKDDFTTYLFDALRSKIFPTDFSVTIEEGKNLLRQKNYEEGYKIITLAKTMNDKPTLACYYAGECKRLLNENTLALKEYEEGLSYNKIHYKCLIGKFEVLEKQKKYIEAYEVVEKITDFFPVSPQRLGKIFTLAVHTKNFADAEKYLKIYEELEYKPPNLRMIVTAALYVCGRYYLEEKKTKEAVKVFKDAIYNSFLDISLIEKCVRFLCDKGLADEAKDVLNAYPFDKKSDAHFGLMETLVHFKAGSYLYVTQINKDLSKEDRAPLELYEMVIESYIQTNNLKQAEGLAYKAIQKFPQSRAQMNKFIDYIEQVK